MSASLPARPAGNGLGLEACRVQTDVANASKYESLWFGPCENDCSLLGDKSKDHDVVNFEQKQFLRFRRLRLWKHVPASSCLLHVPHQPMMAKCTIV